jgi:hypothetical protein
MRSIHPNIVVTVCIDDALNLNFSSRWNVRFSWMGSSFSVRFAWRGQWFADGVGAVNAIAPGNAPAGPG